MSRFYYDDVLPCVIPQLILCGPGVCQHYMTFVAQPVARVLLLYIYIYICYQAEMFYINFKIFVFVLWIVEAFLKACFMYTLCVD